MNIYEKRYTDRYECFRFSRTAETNHWDTIWPAIWPTIWPTIWLVVWPTIRLTIWHCCRSGPFGAQFGPLFGPPFGKPFGPLSPTVLDQFPAQTFDHLALHVSGAFPGVLSTIWARLQISGRSDHFW